MHKWEGRGEEKNNEREREREQQAFNINIKYHNIPTMNARSFQSILQVYKMCSRKMLD
jgi:hypothetical protein